MTSEREALYNAALAADQAFQRAVIAQFGKRRAPGMRYQSAKHNQETTLARLAFHAASDALRNHPRS